MKKIFVSLFVTMIVSAFTLALSASAAEVSGEYYENNNFFVISCTADAANIRKPVTLKVYENDIDVYTSQRRAGDDGSIRFAFKLPIDSSKSYMAKINLNGQYQEVAINTGEVLKAGRKYNTDKNELLISGTYVFDSEDDNHEITIIGKLGEQEKFNYSVFPDSGTYAFEKAIPFAEFPYGDYSIEINAENGKYVRKFDFKYKDAASIIELLKSSSVKEIEEILSDDDNIAMLSLDNYTVGDDTLKTLPEDVYKIIANQIVNVNSIDTLKLCISQAHYVYKINSANSAEGVLKLLNDGDKTVFDFENFALFKIYKQLSAEDQTEVLNTVKDADLTTFNGFKDTLTNGILLTNINNMEHWSQLKKFMEEYNGEYFKFTKTLTNDQYVYLFDRKPFLTMSGFADQYAAASNINSGSTGGTGSSGSSGSKSSGNKGGGAIDVSGGYFNNNVSKNTFGDIDSVPWAKEAIEYLFEKNVINGIGNNEFAPMDAVTREQYTKMIVLAFEIGDAGYTDGFSDVKSTDWSCKYINSAVQAGIVNGMEDNLFGGGYDITREDVAVICYRALKSRGVALDKSAYEFSDESSVSDYAKEAVSCLANAGIINGEGGNMFNPKAKCTRAQVAKIIYFALNYLNK